MYLIGLYLLYFFAYSALGWVHEVLYSLVFSRKLHNPGFLIGPLLPIYGFGAVAIVAVAPYIENPFLLFVASAFIATLIEYVGHLLLSSMFHIQLWDYSRRRFNLQGRVCLENSLGFGMLALLVVYVVHPPLARLFSGFPETAVIAVAFALLGAVLVDLGSSVWTLIEFRPEVGALRESFAEMQHRAQIRLLEVQALTDRVQQRLDGPRLTLLQAHNRNLNRLRKAFPDAVFVRGRSGARSQDGADVRPVESAGENR